MWMAAYMKPSFDKKQKLNTKGTKDTKKIYGKTLDLLFVQP